MLDGTPAECATAAVIWGEPGNNAQHSFFQLLHQGTPRAALDFLLPANSSCGNQPQQNLAIANCLAQAEAFMDGQIARDGPRGARARRSCRRRSRSARAAQGASGQSPEHPRAVPAARPGDTRTLIALYEHKVFTQSVVWGINAFDQWGVELGKKLTAQLAPAVQDPAAGHAAPAALLPLLEAIAEWRA